MISDAKYNPILWEKYIYLQFAENETAVARNNWNNRSGRLLLEYSMLKNIN